MKLQKCLARPREFLTSELLMSWILAGRQLHFLSSTICTYICYSRGEVPAVLKLIVRNQLMCVTSTLTGKSNSGAAMFHASFLLAIILSSAILRTNLHITAFGLCEEELDERYQNH